MRSSPLYYFLCDEGLVHELHPRATEWHITEWQNPLMVCEETDYAPYVEAVKKTRGPVTCLRCLTTDAT